MKKLPVLFAVVAVLALAGAATAGVEQPAVSVNALCEVQCTSDGLCQGVLLSGSTQVGTVNAIRDGANFSVVVTTSTEWPLGIVTLTLPGIPHTDTRSFVPPYPATTTFGPFAIPATGCIQVQISVTEGVVIDTTALTAGLPSTVHIRSLGQGQGNYWNLEITGGSNGDGTPNGSLDGTFAGWCVDVGHTWGGGSIIAQVYSGYPSTPSNINIDHPENMDLVNWVLNNFKPGDIIIDGGGTNLGAINWADLQKAIWALVDDNPASTTGLPAIWSQLRVNHMVDAALAYPGPRPYVPPCGGLVAVILAPTGGQQAVIAQVVAAQLPVNCPAPPTASTCFTCCLRGSLSVTKAVNWIRHIPATTEFQICITGPSYAEPNCKTFTDGQTQTWSDLLPGEYTVSEALAEGGWTILGVGPVTVVERGTATATVTNNYQDCTLTPGYWKTHSTYGPAPYDDTWANVGEDTPFFKSGQTWYQVLWTEPQGGNGYYILAHAFIATKLNAYGGLTTVPEVDAVLGLAEDFFKTYLPTTRLSKELRQEVVGWATLLDNFNNGLIGPGHCD